MLKYIKFFFLILFFTFLSCVNHKKVNSSGSKSNKKSNIAELVLRSARSYIGTKYKLGGTNALGMDCSGLLYSVFKEYDITLPRTSLEQSKVGEVISLKNVKVGDMIFFTDKKDGRNVNHAGIISFSHNGEVKFIHASTSKGVREDNLAGYWLPFYFISRRVL